MIEVIVQLIYNGVFQGVKKCSNYSSDFIKKNAKGNRKFTSEDIKNLKLIYHLVKERGFTLEGAKIHIKEDKKQALDKYDIIEKLENIKTQLNKIKSQL